MCFSTFPFNYMSGQYEFQVDLWKLNVSGELMARLYPNKTQTLFI